jgi:hypothetical protein
MVIGPIVTALSGQELQTAMPMPRFDRSAPFKTREKVVVRKTAICPRVTASLGQRQLDPSSRFPFRAGAVRWTCLPRML